jgi:hypothetical protein
MPEVVAGARANRAFLRATCYTARGCSIDQFLDIGVGLPAPGATHEIAQRANPDCRIVYADNDCCNSSFCVSGDAILRPTLLTCQHEPG